MRHRGLVIAAAVLAITVGLPGPAGIEPALASHGTDLAGPPDADGHMAHCDVSFSTATIGQYTIKCQYGPVSGYLRDVNVRFYRTNGQWFEVGSTDYQSTPERVTESGNGRRTYSVGTYNEDVDMSRPPECRYAFIDQSRYDGGGYWNNYYNSSACSASLRPVGEAAVTPAEHWPGGSGPVAPMAQPAVTCSRVMVDRETTFANFTAEATTELPAGAADGWSWDWGDSTPAWPNRTAGHDYPALETMPTNGWTATVTLTRTRGSEVVTKTCAVRVDFNQPDKSEAGSDSTSEDDYDCPTGLGWINPLAILKILKCLFIPSGADLDGLSDFYGEAKTKAPFSYLVQVVTFVPDVMGSLAAGGVDGATYDDGSPNCGSGVFTGGRVTGGGTPVIDLPGTADGVAISNPTGCAAGTGGVQSVDDDGGQWFARMHQLMKILYLVGLAIGVWSIVTWAIS
jgi:hypothetical protein